MCGFSSMSKNQGAADFREIRGMPFELLQPLQSRRAVRRVRTEEVDGMSDTRRKAEFDVCPVETCRTRRVHVATPLPSVSLIPSPQRIPCATICMHVLYYVDPKPETLQPHFLATSKRPRRLQTVRVCFDALGPSCQLPSPRSGHSCTMRAPSRVERSPSSC